MDEQARTQLEVLLRLFEQYGLEELIVEEGELKVHLRRGGEARPTGVMPVAAASAAVPAVLGAARQPEPLIEDLQNTVAMRSPLIGVFYRSPSPEAPPFVNVGDIVREGQTVCIVEAMKVFNEIKSDWAGRVKEVPAQDGALVQPGDPLVVLEFLDGR